MKIPRDLINGIAGLLILFCAAILFFPCFCASGTMIRSSSCQSNLKQITAAFGQYMQDYNGRFPPVATNHRQGWADLIRPYLSSRKTFQCPEVKTPAQDFRSDYFYNARLARIQKARLTRLNSLELIVLVADGADEGLTGSSLTQLPFTWTHQENSPAKRHRDGKGANYAFVDGHVKFITLQKMIAAQKNENPDAAYTFEATPG